MGNPWLFSSIRQKLEYPASEVIPPAPVEKRETALMHLRYAVEIFGEQMGVRQFRNHLAWYARGVRGSAAFRSAISSISELSEMEEMIDAFFLEQEKGPVIAPEAADFRQISKLS